MGKFVNVTALLMVLAGCLAFFMGGGFDHDSVRGQRVLVTGASTGIGEQLAYQYASLGARLVLTARREAQLRNVSKTCEALGAQEVHFVVADMVDPEDRIRVIAQAEEQLQGGLDCLILNHAVLINNWFTGNAENMATLEEVMSINFFSYVDLASKALPMLVANQGRIGVVSSAFGEIATVKSSWYSASKFALHGFFSSLRQEFRLKDTSVSVTVIVLGPVATDTYIAIDDGNFPINSMSSPRDAARVILESVDQRLYKVRFDWKIQALMLMNDWFPAFSEDNLPSLVLNKNMTLLTSLLRFVAHTLYRD